MPPRKVVYSAIILIIIALSAGFLLPPQTTVHQQSYDFSLTDLNGQKHRFSDYRGKIILVNFWATWCPPCRKEMPGFNRVYQQWKSHNFVILGIAMDNPDAVRTFISEAPVDYPILLANNSAAELSRLFGNHQGLLPYSILFDHNGSIRYRAGGLLSEEKLDQQLSELF